MILFAVSVLLTLGVAWRISRLAAKGTEQFWLGLAAVVLPWGLMANVLSLGNGLTPAGWVAAQCAIAAAVFVLPARWRWPSHPLASPHRLSPGELALAACLAAIIGCLAMEQWVQPLWIGDEIRYHASRVLYWMGQQSIFPYATHNDRQTYFAYQGELAFLWPVLLTRSELAGRMMFWLAVPGSCVALYAVARRLQVSRSVALAMTLWFVLTPIVLRHGFGLKPEMWLTLFVLGMVWWTIEAVETRRPAGYLMTGLYCALAVSTKLSLLAIVPVVLAAPWLAAGATRRGRSVRAIAAGFCGAVLMSGVALLLLTNTIHAGHPLGPKGMREVHSAPLSLQQIRTHLARLPLLLIDPPMAPSAGLRTTLEAAGQGWLSAAGASEPLPLERPDGWPGQFRFTVDPVAKNFSLGGLVLLCLLVAGAARAAKEWRRQGGLTSLTLAWLVMAGLVFSVILVLRWMVHSALPERFLLPGYAIAMAIVPVFLPARIRAGALAAGLVWSAYNPVVQLAEDTKKVWTTPPSAEEITAPFTEALDHIPPGARILFFGNQDVPDYPLFGAAGGYDRQVIPWGKGPFDAAALDRVVAARGITHILFQDGRTAYFHWEPPLELAGFVQWAVSRNGARRIALETPNMVLVALPAGLALPAAPPASQQLVTEAPAGRRLIAVAPDFRSRVKIAGGRLRTPWPIEFLGEEEQGFLWLGSGPDEGLRFSLWASEPSQTALTFRVGAGPSRTDSVRTLVLRGGPADSREKRQKFTANGAVRFDVTLAKGANPLLVYVEEPATVTSLPNGDTRHLMAGLRDVLVSEGGKPSGALIESSGVTVDTSSLKSPWAIEDLGPPEHEFLWLGSGENEGLRFAITTETAGVVVFRMTLSPGPSRTDRARQFVLQMDGQAIARQRLDGAGAVEFRHKAAAGHHEMKFFATDPANVARLANGDPRHLIAGLHEIRIQAGDSSK